jgi:hypothetical protein
LAFPEVNPVDIKTPTLSSSSIPATNQPDKPPRIHTNYNTMSLERLPQELQTEILFQIVLANADEDHENLKQVFETNIMPYVRASRVALHCWRASWHVILHRVATIRLAATESYRRSLHRAHLLAKLRVCVWLAAIITLYSESKDERLMSAFAASNDALYLLRLHEGRADRWRKYLLW